MIFCANIIRSFKGTDLDTMGWARIGARGKAHGMGTQLEPKESPFEPMGRATPGIP